MRTRVIHIGVCVMILLSLMLPSIATRVTAQGASIELAVDTANFQQDGLLVLFGGLPRQGEIGLPVAAGDLNGDGKADVVFCGMFGNAGNRTNDGVVNVYLSDGRDSGFIDTFQNPSSIFRINGQRSGDLLGTSVSANGDVNGDGIRDLAIGAAGWDAPGAGIRDNRGAAYVVFGSHNPNFNFDLSTADGNPPPGVIAILGPQSDGRAGIWIDEGDVDGDGFADIVIGADQINTSAGHHAGAAYIVFGSASLPSVIDLASPPAGVRVTRILGSGEENHWGAALQVGDINNDGIGDLIIGGAINRDSASYVSPVDDPTGHSGRAADFNGQRDRCGEVFVLYGQHSWPSTIDLRTPPANSTHVIGAHALDFLGSQVHSGDVNGDGKTDLILGALTAQAPDSKGATGAVYVVYGANNIAGATIDLLNPDASGLRVTSIYGEHVLDCAGDSVRTYDINKDGMSDLFIGSPERTFELNGEDRDDAGVTEIIFGQRDFLPPVIKLYDPPVSPRIFRLAGAHGEDQGIDGGDEFSYRLSGGDVDGDGFIDYVANAMHGDGLMNGLPNAGNVYIFSGKKLSAKLGMLQPDQGGGGVTPTLGTARLFLNGSGPVQQANAGQSGLSITITGTNTRVDTQVFIKDTQVTAHVPNPADQNPSFSILLDENTSIRNSTGPLTVKLRNVTPALSGFSNEIVAGTLIGPEITKVKVKKKGSGQLILKISGANFPADASVSVTLFDQQVPVQSASFDPPDYVSAKIAAGNAPAPGVPLFVQIVTAQGIRSNVFETTAK